MKGISYVRKYGLGAFLYRALNKLYDVAYPNRYRAYMKLEKNKKFLMEYKPAISIILYGEKDDAAQAYSSAKNQSYQPCEIIITKNVGKAVQEVQGEYVLIMTAETILNNDCLIYMVDRLNCDECDLIYADSDAIIKGRRTKPFFKPDYSPDLLRCFDYMGVCLFNTNRLKGFLPYDESLLIRFCEKGIVKHISEVLSSHIGDYNYVYKYPEYKHNNPLVSVIIPSKDNYEMLKACVESVFNSGYSALELIVVDNGSDEENRKLYSELVNKYNGRYVYEKADFNFAYMCNVGKSEASGEVLLFLNDDIEAIDDKWLDIMVGQAMCSHTGAVGAKLLYPDKKHIQHCGVMTIQNGPVHYLANREDNKDYYFGRNRAIYNTSAVTAACLMIRREVFTCFEEELEINYNDVALCYSLLERGLYNVVRNDAVLVHHESVSRKPDMKRLNAELAKLRELYPELTGVDGFYNPNLNQHTDDMSMERPYRLKLNKLSDIAYIGDWREDCSKAEIDYVSCGEVISIGGYVSAEEYPIWFYKIYAAALVNQRIYACFDTFTELRYDKEEPMGGFSCNIAKSELSQGSYDIVIVLKNKITGKKLIAKTTSKFSVVLQHKQGKSI